MSKPTIPDSYICPITSELMNDPVSTTDGFTYEREAILEWLNAGNTTSPLTGATLGRTDLIPNHALRSAIQEFIEANPSFKDQLFQPRPAEELSAKIAQRSAEFAAASASAAPPPAVPIVSAEPVQVGLEEPVQALSLAAVPTAVRVEVLSDADAAGAAALAVADWTKLKAKAAPPKRGSGLFGGSKPKVEPSADGTLDPDHLTIRATLAGLGGAALVVGVGSERGLAQFAAMLAAPASAPVGMLELKTLDSDSGFGAGTDGLCATEGFALMLRALAGGACLRGLRELSVQQLRLPGAAAGALARALHGHAALQALELWNVELDDGGGMAIAGLAAAGACPALAKLTLGRHLLGPGTTRAIDEMLDGTAVRVSWG